MWNIFKKENDENEFEEVLKELEIKLDKIKDICLESKKNYSVIHCRIDEIEDKITLNNQHENKIKSLEQSLKEANEITENLKEENDRLKKEFSEKLNDLKTQVVDDVVDVDKLISKTYRYLYKSQFVVHSNGDISVKGRGNGRFKHDVFDILAVKKDLDNNTLTQKYLQEKSKGYYKSQSIYLTIVYNILKGTFDDIFKQWDEMNKIDGCVIDRDKSIADDEVVVNGESTGVDIFIANNWCMNYINNSNPEEYLVNLQKRNKQLSFKVLKTICCKWEVYEKSKKIDVVNNPERRKEMGLS